MKIYFNKFARSLLLADSFVASLIGDNVFVKDELALRLDRPTKDAPKLAFWVHLAQSLNVPRESVLRMHRHSDYRPSGKMFEYLKAKEPEFTVESLRSLLEKIDRNDIAPMLKQSTGKSRYKINRKFAKQL